MVNDDFSILSNRLFSTADVEKGVSDGNGNVYFLGSQSSRAVLVKLQESDYSIVFEKDYGHISQGSAYVHAVAVQASANSLLVSLTSNLNPAWSVDSNADFLVLRLDTAGSAVVSAFGFGSNTGSSERSHALIYIEGEDAAVVTFLD